MSSEESKGFIEDEGILLLLRVFSFRLLFDFSVFTFQFNVSGSPGSHRGRFITQTEKLREINLGMGERDRTFFEQTTATFLNFTDCSNLSFFRQLAALQARDKFGRIHSGFWRAKTGPKPGPQTRMRIALLGLLLYAKDESLPVFFGFITSYVLVKSPK